MPENTPPKNISWSKVIITVLVIVLVAGLISGFLFWYFLVRQPTESTSITTNVATSSSKTASDSAKTGETAGWKIYTSTSLGFSIKYPSGWYTKETPSDSTSPLTYAYIGEKDDLSDGFVLVVTADSNGFVGKEYDATEKLEINKAITGSTDSGSHVVKRLPNITVDKITALVWTEKPAGEGSIIPYNETVYVKNGTKAYKIWTTAKNQNDFDVYQERLDLMLSTFKFL